MKKFILLVSMVAVFIVGCQNPQSCVLISNQTGIGISVKENPQTQLYEAWVGYINSVFGLVPTNRAWDKEGIEKVGGGASDSTDVLFETNFTNWFCFWSTQGIYQRVAIGKSAVSQPGAVAMFLKDANGTANPEAVKALANVMTESRSVSALKASIAKYYVIAANKELIVSVLKEFGYAGYDKFIDSENDIAKVNAVIAKLKEKGLNIQ